ncbi:MAG TPA: hypothetical protein P5189_04630, partial [Methanomassiliicoccales archaeon]|nr:hypothetical protein [Methanomassiliicoccales archaeon]
MEDEQGNIISVTRDVLNKIIPHQDIDDPMANEITDDVIANAELGDLLHLDPPCADEGLHALSEVLLLVQA